MNEISEQIKNELVSQNKPVILSYLALLSCQVERAFVVLNSQDPGW